MKGPNSILDEYGTTIFTVMSALATEHNAINLGQGFPDTDGPQAVREAAAQAFLNGPNQYPPMAGLPDLRQAVAEHNKRFYGLDVDWQSEVIVTSGATEALAACIFGLIEPGDEAVLIEPLYDSYLPILRRAGAVPKLVRIEPPEWKLPLDQLAAAFSDKTKLILFNTPMNPSAKVFTREELEFIAKLMLKHDTYAICDEVYEHLVYDSRQHIPLMTLPGMRDRCLRIGSAGKTFSMTGWKVGYTTGAPALVTAVARAHQFLTFTTPPGLQKAVADGLRQDDAYFAGLSSDLQRKRDRVARGLAEIGFGVMQSQGTYFIGVDFRPLGFNGDDVEFCKYITTEAGVAAVPFSAFYKDGVKSGVDHFARFCYCKQDSLLDAAIERLATHFKTRNPKKK